MTKLKNLNVDTLAELIKDIKKASGKINRQSLFYEGVTYDAINNAKNAVQTIFENKYSFATITSGRKVIFNYFSNTQLLILKDQEGIEVKFDEDATNRFAELLFGIITHRWTINTNVLATALFQNYFQDRVRTVNNITDNNIEKEREKRTTYVTEILHSGDYSQQVTYVYMRGKAEDSEKRLIDVLTYNYNKDIGYGNYKPLPEHNGDDYGIPSVDIEVSRNFKDGDLKDFSVKVNWSTGGAQTVEVTEQAAQKLLAGADIARQIQAKIDSATDEWNSSKHEDDDEDDI